MRPGPGPESLRKRASFSKATPRCPASRRVFPALGNAKKPLQSSGFSRFRPIVGPRSEPLGTAPVPVAVTVPASLESTMSPASARPAFHMGQDGEATLLAIVEGLVERVGRVRDLL